MRRITKRFVTLRFSGPRFEGRGLEVDVLPELVAYKKLLVETAKELWRRNHPRRERLPRGYEERIKINLRRVEAGSVVVSLAREYRPDESRRLFPAGEDEVDRAASLLEDGMAAAGADEALPQEFPRSVLPHFADFGKTLARREHIEIRSARRRTAVPYTPAVRERLMNWVGKLYEDTVDIVGEVRAADLDGRSFVVRLEDGSKVQGKFTAEQEATVTEALRDHETCRLSLRGRGEFTQEDGLLRRIIHLDEMAVLGASQPRPESAAASAWEAILAIGAKVPDEEWAKVPKDLARNLDHYLYGAKKANG